MVVETPDPRTATGSLTYERQGVFHLRSSKLVSTRTKALLTINNSDIYYSCFVGVNSNSLLISREISLRQGRGLPFYYYPVVLSSKARYQGSTVSI